MPVERRIPGGRVVFEADQTLLFASPSRLAREAAGAARVPSLSPRLLAEDTEKRVYEAVEPLEGRPRVLTAVSETLKGSLREHLLRLYREFPEGDPNPLKGLATLLGRGSADRALSREILAEYAMGPISLGGLWGRCQDGRVVSIVLEKARESGSLTLDGADAGTAAGVGALYHAILQGDAEKVKELLENLSPRPPRIAQGQRFRLHLEGPSFLTLGPWIPQAQGTIAEDIPFNLALAAVRELQGTWVGGQRLHLRVDPPLEKPAVPPYGSGDHRRLFTRWNQGIQTDEEGLFSLTPEGLAHGLARRLKGPVIDGTTGVGALAIACAQVPGIAPLWAIDLHKERLQMARHNANIYKVADRIHFLSGDLLRLLPRLPPEATLLLDPPWGGRAYDRNQSRLSHFGMDLWPILSAHRGPVVLKLPRSFVVEELPGCSFEPAVDDRGVLKFLWGFRAAC